MSADSIGCRLALFVSATASQGRDLLAQGDDEIMSTTKALGPLLLVLFVAFCRGIDYEFDIPKSLLKKRYSHLLFAPDQLEPLPNNRRR